MLRPSAARRAAHAAAALRVAIIGSGPSGFYSAARIMANADAKSLQNVQVHMYERLPVPNGLVRYGVAPDHLDVKNVENRFGEIAADPRFEFFGNVNVTLQRQEAAAAHNAAVSRYMYPRAIQLPLASLARHYTHIIFAYGCSESRLLGVPGSDPGQLRNVHSALDFVNWYNGHPTAHDPEVLAKEPWRRVNLQNLHSMSIIGAGNVALDVARIVLRSSAASSSSASASTREALVKGDVPEPVMDHLSSSKIADVDVNARRGPAQVAFTNKELREMMALPGIAFHTIDDAVIKKAETEVAHQEEQFHKAGKDGHLSPDVAAEEAGKFRIRKRLLSLLAKGSKAKVDGSEKRWSLNFFRAPKAFEPAHSDQQSPSPARIGSIKWTATSLGEGGAAVPTASTSTPTAAWGNEPPSGTTPPSSSSSSSPAAIIPSGSSRPASRVAGSEFTTQTDAVVSSVGYRGSPLDDSPSLPSSSKSSLVPAVTGQGRLSPPWDAARGVISNLHGRVVDADGNHIQGLYVAGWLARGPVGVIASTMHDAYAVSDTLFEDYLHTQSASSLVDDGLQSPLPGLPVELQHSNSQANRQVVRWKDWQRIDAVERQRGQELGKVREKIVTVQEMLAVIA